MNRKKIGLGDTVYLGLVFLLAYLTGCSGWEVGGKLGLYEVTQRDENLVTKTRSIPLHCRFVNCNKEAAYDK